MSHVELVAVTVASLVVVLPPAFLVLLLLFTCGGQQTQHYTSHCSSKAWMCVYLFVWSAYSPSGGLRKRRSMPRSM